MCFDKSKNMEDIMKSIINFFRKMFSAFNSKQKEKIVLTEEQKERIKKRGNCPFFGFIHLSGYFADSDGNGCGPSGEMRPCRMGIADWSNCSYNTLENVEILSELTIFPKELNSSEGILVSDWMKIFEEVRGSSD